MAARGKTTQSTRDNRGVLMDALAVLRNLQRFEQNQLAGTGSGEGASSINLADSDGLFTATNIEAILDEIGPHIPVEITDPGDAGAIPVTQAGQVNLVTGGAETRTLADPTMVGQKLSLYFLTDGGDCVVTAASAINAAGNTVMTFANAGEHITLIGARDGATAYAWHIMENGDGVVLS